jgi:hypothetical protein
MASYRNNGPMCLVNHPGFCPVDEGTLCLRQSASPVTVGVWYPPMILRAEVKFTVREVEPEIMVIAMTEVRAWLKSLVNERRDLVGKAAQVAQGTYEIRKFIIETFPAVKFVKITTRTYKGEEYLILKGYPGLREVFTGTRYKIASPLILKYGVGKVGVLKSAMKGTFVSIIIVSTVDVAQAFLSDDKTLRDTLGLTITVDIAKALIGTALAVTAATVAAAFTTVAIVPIAAGLIVGIVAGFVIDHYYPTDKIVKEMSAWFDRQLARAQKALAQAGQIVRELEEVLDAIQQSVKVVRQTFDQDTWRLLLVLSSR